MGKSWNLIKVEAQIYIKYMNKYCICTFLKKTWSFAYGMKVRKVADELSQSSGSRLSWNTEKM